MSERALELLRQTFKRRIRANASGVEHGQCWLEVQREALLEVCAFLRDEPHLRCAMLVDVTAVDLLEAPASAPVGGDSPTPPRFQVVYQLLSLEHGHRVRLVVPIPGDDPWCPTVTNVWKSALFPEREIFDLFGVSFRDHPDLRRLLLDERFEGHPLRKDYPAARRQDPLGLQEAPDAVPTQAEAPPQLSTPPA